MDSTLSRIIADDMAHAAASNLPRPIAPPVPPERKHVAGATEDLLVAILDELRGLRSDAVAQTERIWSQLVDVETEITSLTNYVIEVRHSIDGLRHGR